MRDLGNDTVTASTAGAGTLSPLALGEIEEISQRLPLHAVASMTRSGSTG